MSSRGKVSVKCSKTNGHTGPQVITGGFVDQAKKGRLAVTRPACGKSALGDFERSRRFSLSIPYSAMSPLLVAAMVSTAQVHL